MEIKKDPSVDLNKQRPLFFGIGLGLSLLLVTILIEWRTYDRSYMDLGQVDDIFDEQLEVPLTEQPPPPPPPPVLPEIIEVPDEEEIEEDIIDIDVEVTEETIVEDIVMDDLEEDVDEIFTIVEEQPLPEGGLAAFYGYVGKNLRYPRQASRMGIEGRVTLRFVVERNGTLTQISVLKGIGGGCDEEALRVIRECPIKWKPGKQRGKPVRVNYIIPIYFKIK